MLIRATTPQEYHYRGLVYRWEEAGDALEVPDELGRYLMGRGYGVFSAASGAAPDPAPPTHTTDAGGIGHTAGADDGEDEG